MSKKKGSSCLGLFFKGFIVTTLVLANLGALGVIVGIKFLSFDYGLWTDFSVWNARPFLLLYACLAVAFCAGGFLGVAGAAVSAIFGGGDDKKSSGPKKSRPKPQSNRRTTI